MQYHHHRMSDPPPPPAAVAAVTAAAASLKFVPFASSIESAFWVRYAREKLETIHLDETPIPIRLTYGVNHSSSSNSISSSGSNSGNSSNSSAATATMIPPRLQCHDRSLLLSPPPQNQQQPQQPQPQQQPTKHQVNDDDTSSLVVASESTWTNNECVYVLGDMIGYNTLESFQKVDKNRLLQDYFVQRFLPTTSTTETTTMDHATDSQIVQSLNCALLISYADLKSHSVVYWFGIPTLVPQSSIQATIVTTTNQSFLLLLLDTLQEQFHLMRQTLLLPSQVASSFVSDGGLPPYFIFYYNMDDQSKAKCYPLCMASYRTICTECPHHLDHLYFGFVDPLLLSDSSTVDSTLNIPPHMGWPMRNMIAYLSMHLHLGGQDVSVISYRTNVMRRINVMAAPDDIDDTRTTVSDDKNYSSIVMKVRIPTKEEYNWNTTYSTADDTTTTKTSSAPLYKVVGWELNARYKPGPRSVNLRPLLDPNHLAIQAADLNLKLMKWRMIPDLQVEQLQSTKVLLLGAGTLGCNVARVLLGWGIRNIKILDYGKVSYSNPVRQSLFTISDCHADNGAGRMKAIAAADTLKLIAADVASEGIVLSIPMPGHPDKEDVIVEAVEVLDSLIQEADVVYLLTDTRESRWLPTVICSAYNKILINAALGLDSWLVMRHGAASTKNEDAEGNVEQSTTGSNNLPYRLGCYFCSDVVAPENSTKNRTLDQQCTVTRPGLALIASSMAVELMVSLLHHPKRIFAPAPKNSNGQTNTQYSPTISSNDANVTAASSTLGIIPHSIRGSLVSYTMMTPTVPAFQYCTGCSLNVTQAYLDDKMMLVQQCCQTTDGSYLEEISGLTAFRLAATEKLVDMEGWEDDE